MRSTLNWTRGVGKTEYWFSGNRYDVEATPDGKFRARVAATGGIFVEGLPSADAAKAACEEHRIEVERVKAMREEHKQRIAQKQAAKRQTA